MPSITIDELDLRANTPQFDLAVNTILGVMLYPDDEPGRATFQASMVNMAVSKTNRRLGQRAVWVEIDINRPDIELRNPVKIAREALIPVVTGRADRPDAPKFSGPDVAALILEEAIDLSRSDTARRGVTLKACLESVSAALGKLKSAKGASTNDLKEQWHKHRRAAPISLAFSHMRRVFGDETFLNDPESIVTMCRLANGYLVEGEGIRHRNAEVPILPSGECWEMLIRPRANSRGTLVQKIT